MSVLMVEAALLIVWLLLEATQCNLRPAGIRTFAVNPCFFAGAAIRASRRRDGANDGRVFRGLELRAHDRRHLLQCGVCRTMGIRGASPEARCTRVGTGNRTPGQLSSGH